MIADSSSHFKTFRVLWFPISVNAILLGAASITLFHLGTTLIASLAGDAASAGRYSANFMQHLLGLIQLDGLPPDADRFVFSAQCVLALALWSLIGVAICRVLALRICRDEYCSMGDALGYSWRVRRTGILFPLAIALPMLVLAGFNALAGLVFQIPLAGWLLSALMLPLTLLASFLLVIIAIGAFFSLGLVPAAIAVERRGTYDSIGKAFNYLLARPLVVIANALLVGVLLWGLFDIFVTRGVVAQVLQLSTTPFFPNDTYEAILKGQVDRLAGFEWFCAQLHHLVLVIFDVVLRGLFVSLALGASTSLFLVLRRDIDGLDEAELAREPE